MIPQAFTTRDMAEAYKWVQTLPQHVREEMKSMEQVVSLYLRAKRLGGGPVNVQAPTSDDIKASGNSEPVQTISKNSSQEFQKTLKNLKVELEQFDFAGQQQALPHTAQSSLNLHHSNSPHSNPYQAPPQNQGPAPASNHNTQGPPHNQEHPLPHGAPISEQTSHLHNNALAAVRMDPRSRQMINEIREGLNLSSDLEVIRMSLVLAHKSLIGLIK